MKYIKIKLYLLRTGDQDWFNMLSWSHPELVYILPCVYNWQTSVQVYIFVFLPRVYNWQTSLQVYILS